MSFSRMIPFLLLNIIVSAIVVIVILTFWDRRGATPPPTGGVGDSAEIITTDNTVIDPVVQPVIQEEIAVLAPTAQPAEQPGRVTHIVAAGELLGNISVQFDVAVEDIVTANGLTDPNQIFVGQELIIPVGGLEQPTAEPAPVVEEIVPTESVPPTAVPTVAVNLGESTIEIAAVTNVGELANESVQITNIGANAVSLEGWTLAEESGQAYTFGNVNLFPGGAAIQLLSRSAENSGANYYWNLGEAAWQAGETATLRDATGNVQATFTIP